MTGKNVEFTIDYRNTIINNAFVNIMNSKELTEDFNRNRSPETINDIIQSAKVICIASDTLSKTDVEYIISFSNNKRVYILLGDNNPDNVNAIKRLAGRCFIRTGVPQSGSIILTDMQTQNGDAFVFQSNSIKTSTEEYIHAISSKKWLYQTFCYLFWKSATYSYKSEEGKPTSEDKSPVYDIPIDEIYAKRGELFNRLNHDIDMNTEISSAISNKKWLETLLPVCKTIDIFNDENPEDKAVDVSSLCSKADNVYLCKSNPGKWNNTIRLNTRFVYIPSNPNQTEVNWCCCEKNFTNSVREWELHRSVTLDTLENNRKLQYSDEIGKIYRVRDSCTVKLDPISTESFEEYFSDDKDVYKDFIIFKRENPAKAIEYHGIIHPPYLPVSAKNEYLGWNGVEDKWKKYITSLENDLNNYLNEIPKLPESVRKKIIGGVHKAESDIRNRIDTLKKFTFLSFTTPRDRDSCKIEYDTIKDEIDNLFNQKKMVEEHNKKLDSWNQKKLDLEEKINILEKKKMELEVEINNLQDANSDESSKNKNQKLLDGRKKEQEGILKNIESLKNKLKSLEDEVPKEQTKNQREESSFEKVLKPGNQNNDSGFSLSYPKNDLPKSGKLYSHNNTRYLLISSATREEYEKSKEDANRLNAIICVKEV